MNTRRPWFALSTGAIALIVAASIYLPRLQTSALAVDSFPKGQTSPEGAACDLMRAYMARDETLFHERRCKQYCEGWANSAIAYSQFLDYRPRQLPDSKTKKTLNARPQAIAKVRLLPVRMTEEQSRMKRLGLLLTDGAYESRFVDIVTTTNSGERYVTRIEALNMSRWDEAQQKSAPSGIWRARIIDNDALPESTAIPK